MKVKSVLCNNCGGPLELKPKIRFVTCNFCGSNLKVEQSGNALYTEMMEGIDDRTRQIAEDVNIIKRQNEIEQMDREWMAEQERYKVKGKDGNYSIPTQGESIFAGGIAIGGGILWSLFAVNMGAPVFFPLFGLLFISFGAYAAINGYQKATKYQQEKAKYQQKRRNMMDRHNE